MYTPATITKLKRLDSGDLRLIELTLPGSQTIDGQEHPVQDGMRPGSGFWIEPQRQPYLRSNCSVTAQGHLETIISDTYDQSDTWSLWQTEGIKEGDTVGVRVDADPGGHFLKIHEARSLALEPDSWWLDQDFAAIAFSTGVAPFLAHIR